MVLLAKKAALLKLFCVLKHSFVECVRSCIQRLRCTSELLVGHLDFLLQSDTVACNIAVKLFELRANLSQDIGAIHRSYTATAGIECWEE